MSKYFEVLQRAARDKDLMPGLAYSAPPSNGSRPETPLDDLAREEVTKLVQSVFLLPGDERAPRAVLFCGVEHGYGSSWICAHAAKALTAQGTGTVCVLDANLRSPSVHEHFGASNLRGLANALLEAGPVCDFAQPFVSGNLWLVSGGSVVPDLYTPVGGERLRTCLAELRTQFSYVLINAPPVNVHAGAVVLGKLSDGVILVVEANLTRRETTRQVKERLEGADVRILGAVLNKRTFPIPEALYRRL